jgi:hypothetical protein
VSIVCDAYAVLLVQVLICVGGALVTAGALAALCARLSLGRLRTVAAAAAAGALAALIASELLIDRIGPWWADHPMTGATVTGALLLALTVVVIEAAIDHTLRAAEERRWTAAGGAAASAILVAVAVPVRRFGEEVMWPTAKFLGDNIPTLSAAVWDPSEADELSPDGTAILYGGPHENLQDLVQTAVLTAAPVMTATERLHEIYAHALQASDKAAQLRTSTIVWRENYAQLISLRTGAGVAAREFFWDNVDCLWLSLLGEMRRFHELAVRELQGGIFGLRAPWHDKPPSEYTLAKEWHYKWVSPDSPANEGDSQH